MRGNARGGRDSSIGSPLHVPEIPETALTDIGAGRRLRGPCLSGEQFIAARSEELSICKVSFMRRHWTGLGCGPGARNLSGRGWRGPCQSQSASERCGIISHDRGTGGETGEHSP